MISRKDFLGYSGLLGTSLLLPGNSFCNTPTHASLQPLLARPRLANSYWYIGHLISVLFKSEDTGGLFSLLRVTEVKGLEPPPHTHTREDETFLLVDGEIEFTVGQQSYHASAGDAMFLPRNIQHSFKVLTNKSEVLMLLSPGGFEKYFIEMSEPAPELREPPVPAGPPDVAKIITTASRYGIKFPEKPPVR